MSNQYEEINLVNYIKIVFKRKKVIINVAIIILLLTIGFALLKTPPKTYQTDALIKIGQVSGQLLEPKTETESMIMNEAVMQQILKKAGIQNLTKETIQSYLKNINISDGDQTKTNTEQPTQTNFFKIRSKADTPDLAIKITQEVINTIFNRHQTVFALKIKQRDINLAQTEKQLADMEKQLAETEKNIQNIQSLRYPAAYVIAQVQAIANYLSSRDALKKQISDLQQSLFSQKIVKESDIMSEVISQPLTPNQPIKQQKLSIIISITTVLGLFIGLVFAFCVEWWEKNKAQVKGSTI